jgi:GntR family transcriptional regulator
VSDRSNLINILREEANLEAESATPLYLRVQRGLEQAIEAGMIAVNDALPAERELANALGVSRVTVRNAVRALVEKGMLVQRHGAGTFVASRVEQPLKQLTGFTEDMSERGMAVNVQWLDRSIGLPTPEECEALKIDSSMAVSRLYRLRLADEKPMCIEHAVLPISYLEDPMAVETSLYDYLEGLKRRPSRAIQKLSARLLDISHAHFLGVPTGSPCLYIERTSFLPNDEPIEFVRSYYRGDSYEFVAELRL